MSKLDEIVQRTTDKRNDVGRRQHNRPASTDGEILLGCILLFIIVIIAAAIQMTAGGFMVDYCLYSYFAHDIPWWGDAIIGLFTAQLIVPVTVIAFILRVCGIPVPLIR